MGTEIERKFLVDATKLELPAFGTEIRQGYLVRDAERSVRVRLSRVHRPDGTTEAEAFLTVKGSGGLVRAEYEYAIPPADAEDLLDDLCLPGQIEKTRYEVDVADRVFEVDVFGGRHLGTIVAEVEFDDAHEAVVLPDWVTDEVTDDPAWTNAAMSRVDN
ncbi:MAG: CYTH domain-containing protein [Acidimicrobiales bacterium]